MEREKGFPQLFWATNKFKTHNEVTIVFEKFNTKDIKCALERGTTQYTTFVVMLKNERRSKLARKS